MLVDGVWQAEDLKRFKRDANQVRFSSGFHYRIGSDTAFPAEPNRYVLYFNWTCPWSHRATVTRQLKGLDEVIDIVLLEPSMGKEGWWFGETDSYHDPAISAKYLHELYSASDSAFTGRVSVPILWDTKTSQIVNNDSGEIARMFNDEFNEFAKYPEVDFYPAHLRAEIDPLNEFIAKNLNDGVYRCLLAPDQAEYEKAFDTLFESLDELEQQLSRQRYLLGDVPTEPDWRAFACLSRFDMIYYSLYKCNLRRIVDYPNLWEYTRDLYQLPGVALTVKPQEIKRGYYGMIHRGGFVPKGPEIDFLLPHHRDELAHSSLTTAH